MRDDSVIPLVLAVTVAIGVFAVLGGGVTASGESTALPEEATVIQDEAVPDQHSARASHGATALDGERLADEDTEPAVEQPAVEVTAIQADTVVAEWERTISFNATVTNTGDGEATQEIEFAVEGVGVLDSETVSLDGGEQRVVEFTAIDTTELAEEGEYEFTVSSDDDSKGGTLVVGDPGPAVLFEVFDIHIETDPENVTVDEPEDVEVSATVRNAGAEPGTQTIELRADDVAVEETELALDPDQAERVTFTRTAVNHTPGQEYTYSVASENDEVVGTLLVQESADTDDPTDDSDDTDDTDATADDDGPGFGIAAAILALLVSFVLAVTRRTATRRPES